MQGHFKSYENVRLAVLEVILLELHDCVTVVQISLARIEILNRQRALPRVSTWNANGNQHGVCTC
jgi:hypothetical protein